MILNFIKKYSAPLLCLLLALFVLSKMLFPGFVLTLDMSWTPTVPLNWNTDTPNNTFLVRALLHALSIIIPSWMVQKLMLITLFFLLFYMPWKFLPLVRGTAARMFAAGIFAANPFVYSRMLAGQWAHLFGYAFLPFLFSALVDLSENPSRRHGINFFLALFCIGSFSIHYFYLACVISVIWLCSFIVRSFIQRQTKQGKRIVLYALVGIVGFCIVNLFWILPALTRKTPLEERFNEVYFSAFAAAPNGPASVMTNVAALGGFWGEDMAWRYYFVWPQDHTVFWFSVLVMLTLVLVGLLQLLKDKRTRFAAGVLFSIGVFAYITALGAADTPFKIFNMFLYNYIPFWSGLRDSNKIVGILVIVYAVCSGVGVHKLLVKLKERSGNLESFASIAILALPMVFGMYIWGGFHGQLNPVWYPQDWHEAKAMITALPPQEKVLVLPWHGYISLSFAENRIVSNPAESFFGKTRVLVGRGIGFGSIHDQEIDPMYRDIDTLVANAKNLSPRSLAKALEARGISDILIIVNPAIPRSEEGLTRWTAFSKESGLLADVGIEPTWTELLADQTTTILRGTSIVMKKIMP